MSRLLPKEKNTPALSLVTKPEPVKPGSTKAVLELSSGEKIVLEESANQKIRNTKGEIIGVNTTNTIAFNSSANSCKITEKPNHIYVPIGGEYNVILSDGTQIWVNSDSRLSFPDHFYGAERVVELSGTGTGKTHLLAAIVREFLRGSGSRVWIVAHRRELVDQIEETVSRHGMSKEDGRVRVMSIQWLSRNRKDMYGEPDLIVIDEAHHALAETYRILWEKYPEARKLGMTETFRSAYTLIPHS